MPVVGIHSDVIWIESDCFYYEHRQFRKTQNDCFFTVDEGLVSRTFSLWGDVRVISDPLKSDINVYVMEDGIGADLVVTWVDDAGGCGQWHRVDKGEDFTVCFVSSMCEAQLFISYGDAKKTYQYMSW